MRILEVVLPAPDPEALAAFHGSGYGASRLRFEPGPRVCSHFAVNVPPQRFEEAVGWARERVKLVDDDVPFPAWRARTSRALWPLGALTFALGIGLIWLTLR